jgi:hypothetical protein
VYDGQPSIIWVREGLPTSRPKRKNVVTKTTSEMVLGAIFCGTAYAVCSLLAECPVTLSRGQFFGTRFQIFILIRLYARKERPQAPPEPLDTAMQVRTLFLS